MTLIEVYQREKSKPTPAQVFIAKIADATCRETTTVRQWLSGLQKPSVSAKKRISELIGLPVEELFPEQSENNKKTETVDE